VLWDRFKIVKFTKELRTFAINVSRKIITMERNVSAMMIFQNVYLMIGFTRTFAGNASRDLLVFSWSINAWQALKLLTVKSTKMLPLASSVRINTF
jgi:hypothetical protein